MTKMLTSQCKMLEKQIEWLRVIESTQKKQSGELSRITSTQKKQSGDIKKLVTENVSMSARIRILEAAQLLVERAPNDVASTRQRAGSSKQASNTKRALSVHPQTASKRSRRESLIEAAAQERQPNEVSLNSVQRRKFSVQTKFQQGQKVRIEEGPGIPKKYRGQVGVITGISFNGTDTFANLDDFPGNFPVSWLRILDKRRI